MPRKRTSRYNGGTNSGNEAVFSFSGEEAKTLQDLFDAQASNAKRMEALQKKAAKDVVAAQSKELKSKYTSIYAELKQAELDGVKDISSYKEKLLKKAVEEEYKQRLKRQNSLHEDELKKIQDRMKSNSAKQSDNQSKYNENFAILQMYKQIGDRNLTEEQKKDREDRQKEQERINADQIALKTEETLTKTMQALTDSVKGVMNTVTNLQAHTNARLQGNLSEDTFSSLSDALTDTLGINPYFSNETTLTNLSELINEGIVSNVEQRAFIQTAKENIANTFDVANASLLRIVRLQQSDSSAARLGMEAYLTRYLNGLVDNTEYLNSTFDSVTDALIEAQSQMSTEAGTELEYVVQKWLGALVGVGMSDSTATSIAQALGYLGSGNVDALSNSELQNLLVMAASKSGTLSYSDILENGLSATDADTLMNSLVKYLAEVNTSGSNVVKSQLASTFGVSYSDLKAASSLSESLDDISGNFMSYSGMYDELAYQLDQVSSRLTMAQMLGNVWDNLEFNLGETIASNPALAAIYKVSDLIGENTGGINIPFITAMGTGTDLNTNVDNLIKLGVVGVSSLGLIGDMISGIQTGTNTSGLLGRLGISQNATSIARGTGLMSRNSGLSTSESSVTTISNSSGSDIRESALASATDEAKTNAAADPEQEQKERAPLSIYEWLSVDFSNRFTNLLDCVKDIQEDVNSITSKISMVG